MLQYAPRTCHSFPIHFNGKYGLHLFQPPEQRRIETDIFCLKFQTHMMCRTSLGSLNKSIVQTFSQGIHSSDCYRNGSSCLSRYRCRFTPQPLNDVSLSHCTFFCFLLFGCLGYDNKKSKKKREKVTVLHFIQTKFLKKTPACYKTTLYICIICVHKRLTIILFVSF